MSCALEGGESLPGRGVLHLKAKMDIVWRRIAIRYIWREIR